MAEEPPEFLPVLNRIITRNGLGISLARSILDPERNQELKSLVEEFKVNEARDLEERVHSLGAMLGDYRVFFWGLKMLFSKAVIKGLKSAFWDADKETRLAAVSALDSYNIIETQAIYIRALDDSSDQVRDEALAALKRKVPSEKLVEILEKQKRETASWLNLVQGVKSSLLDAVSGIGEKGLCFGKETYRKGGDLVGAVFTEGAAVHAAFKSKFNSLLKKAAKEHKESPDALYALGLALAWTDEEIETAEKETLAAILKNNQLDKKLAYWIIERPVLAELEPYLKKIKCPEKAFDEIAALLKIKIDGESQLSWVEQIRDAIGIKTE